MNDKLQQLYDLYKSNGLITIDFNTFATANDSQRKGLYDLGVQRGLFSTTPYDTFDSAFSGGQPQQQQQVQQQPVQEDMSLFGQIGQVGESLKTSAQNKPKRGQFENIGKEDENAAFDSQGNYNPINALPESIRVGAKERIAENKAREKVKKKEIEKLASELDLSAQQSLVESTAKQQQEASLLASQQLESDTQNLPFLKNDFLKGVYQQLKEEQALPDFVKDQLNQITPDLINLGEYGPTSMPSALAAALMLSPASVASGAMSQNVAGLSVEEAVVPKMNYMFGPLGFKFEEAGMTGDYMTVMAPNKETIEISLNNMTQSSNTKEATKLKTFIASNAAKIPEIERLAKEYAGANTKFSSEKDIENYASSIGKDYEDLNKTALLISNDIKNFENDVANFNSTPANLINTPEYLQKKAALETTLLDINKKRQDIIAKNDTIEAKKYNLEKSVGKYAQAKSEQGTWTGATFSWLGEGVSSILAGTSNLLIDLSAIGNVSREIQVKENIENSLSDNQATGNPDEDAKNGGLAVDAAVRLNNYIESKGSYDIPISMPKNGQTYKDWYNSLSKEDKNRVEAKIDDDITKKLKKSITPSIRENVQGLITDPNTTVEWKQLAEASFWGGAYAGLVKSAPAMIAPGGWIGRTASFFAQSTDAVNQEMDKNPAFDEVPESEKLLITIPIGIANAVLEEVGFSNVIKNKGFVNSLVIKSLKKAGFNATETTLRKIIKNDVESMIARGALTLTGAGLAEAETGVGQQIAEYAVKDIYNLAKEKEMFKTPDSLKEYVYEVVRAGAQEAVGGFIMGTPSAVGAAYRKRGFEGMSDEQFETFEAIANDDKIQTAFIASLKTKVASRELTMADAKEELNDYRNSVGLYRSIDTELSTEAKKKAMNLVREKQALIKQTEGKDEAIVSRQKNRIAEINVQLNTLSENAVQKQTTSEVPIQSEAGVGQEMERGTPTAESQVTTEEDKNEINRINRETGVLEVGLANPPIVTIERETAPVAEFTTLTQEEQDRKTELETAIAKENGKGTVTIGESLVPTEEAQAELDTLNAKAAAEKQVETRESVEEQRKNELEIFKDNLDDAYEPGSTETVRDAINRKYDNYINKKFGEKPTTEEEKKLSDFYDLEGKGYKPQEELLLTAKRQAKKELEEKAKADAKKKKTLFNRNPKVIPPTDKQIFRRANEIVNDIVKNSKAPSNTDEVLYSVHDLLDGFSRKYGNAGYDHGVRDDRSTWRDGKFFYQVKYNSKGQKYISVISPSTDNGGYEGNPRPSVATVMSFTLPDNVSPEKVGEAAIAKAKEIYNQGQTSNTPVTSKMLIDGVLPIVKAEFVNTPTAETTTTEAVTTPVTEAPVAEVTVEETNAEIDNDQELDRIFNIWNELDKADDGNLKGAAKAKVTKAWNKLTQLSKAKGLQVQDVVSYKRAKAAAPAVEVTPVAKPAPVVEAPAVEVTPTEKAPAPKKPGEMSMAEIEKRFPLAAKFLAIRKYGLSKITAKDSLNMLSMAYNDLMRFKIGAEELLLQIEQIEDLVEALDQGVKKVSKEEFKKQIAESGDFTKAQLKIFNALVDSLQTELMPEYISEKEAAKYKIGENFFMNSLNQIISKEPNAFIHEIGHFAFYKILSKEDRLNYYRYMIDSTYGKGKPSLASRLALSADKIVGSNAEGQVVTASYNVADNFSEYFAEQFRQWYMSERLFPKDIDAIFGKVAQFFNLFIEKLKSGKYVDKNLSEYFNKISVKIENQQKKNEKIQETLGVEQTMMDELQDLEDFLGIDPEISPMSMRYDTPLQKMALMYNMTESGFFPKNVSTSHVNRDFLQFNLEAKQSASGSYYLVNRDTKKMARPLRQPKGGIPPQISPMSVTPISIKNMSMDDVIGTARENGFSDDTIKALLMKRGYAAKDIDSALTFNINFASAYTNNNPRTDSPLPKPFRTIDGGVNAGINLFFDVRNRLIDFAKSDPKVNKTPAEIRAKAIELLEANPIFQAQDDTKQKELIAAFDKTLNTTSGKAVTAQISEIRKAIKERLVGMKDLKKAQLILRNFIRQSLPAVKVPRVFFSLNGLISPAEGINYYNNLRKQVYDFARKSPDGNMGKKILKTTDEIKAFASNLIKNSELYKQQSPEVQKDMENGLINAQYTSGKNHTLDIYSQKEVNKLIDIISQTDSKNFLAQAEKIFDIITEQRAKIKAGLIKDMMALVNNKARTSKTTTGKRRSKGLDAQGQAFYQNIKPILKAAITNDQQALDEIANELSDTDAIDEALAKQEAGEKLTTKEQALLDKVLAFDTFGDVVNMELEEIQNLIDGLKGIRSESIVRLNEKRTERAAQREEMRNQADDQIEKDNPILFNPDGSPKDKNQLDNDKAMIWQAFKEGKVWSGVTKWLERYDFIRNPLTDYFRKTLAHLGTISNILDKSGTFFTDNLYRPLNRMDEVNKTGYLNEMKHLDAMANSIKGITKGYKQIRRMIDSVGVIKMNIIGKGIDLRNGDQLARIYALSLNEVQREKLRNMGYTDQKIKQIKEILGPEVTEFADKLVEYFSNEYYESVNDVYSFVNDVNLGYVENYFPTQTISQSKEEKNDAIKNLEDGNFSGTFDAESSPALKERTDMSNPIDLAPSFTNVVESHLQSMERYKAYAEGVKRLNGLFKIPSVNILLEQTGLKSITKNLVNMSINPNAGVNQEKTNISKVFNKFSGFALAFKLAQIPKQATAIVAAYEDYQFLKGRKVPALDTVMFMFDVAKALTLTRSNFNKFYNLSGNFRDRVNKGVEGDVYGLESGGKVFKPISQKATRLGDVKRFLKSAAASPTMVGDIISVYGYMANYNRDIANGMSPEDALEKFNNYNSTLQSRRAADKSSIQFTQNEYVRAFTMFGSTGILQMNKVAIAYKNIMRAIANKNVPSGKDLRALAINLGVANAMFVAASYAFALIKGDDEDEEKVKKKMFEALVGLNLFYQIPLIGAATEEAVNAIKGEKNMGGDVTNPYSSVFRKIKKYYDEENTVVENFRPLAEIALGTQLDPFIGLYQGTTEEFDDEVMYDILGISPSYRPQNASSLENMSKSEMKKYDPDEYERLYGPGSKGYDKDKTEREEKAADRKARKEAMDDYYNYESEGSSRRGKSRIGKRGSRTSGSRIK